MGVAFQISKLGTVNQKRNFINRFTTVAPKLASNRCSLTFYRALIVNQNFQAVNLTNFKAFFGIFFPCWASLTENLACEKSELIATVQHLLFCAN